MKRKILPCGGCNVVICCGRVTKDIFCEHKRLRLWNAPVSHKPIVSIQFSFLYDALQKIKHESLSEINWDIKMFFDFCVEASKSFAFDIIEGRGEKRAKRSPEFFEILCTAINFVGGAVYQIFFFSRSRALCWLNNMSKKEYQNIFIPPRRFSDFVAWSLSFTSGGERK